MTKEKVIACCAVAEITDKAFIKTVLLLERRVRTCKAMQSRGASWNTLCSSKPYEDAGDALDALNGSGCGYAKYLEQWKRFCAAAELCWDANLGDWLA